jgi:hypothetical protein
MKSLVLYCHFRKFSMDSAIDVKNLKNKLAKSEAKNVKLKETVAQQD